MRRFELDLTEGAEAPVKIDGEPINGVSAVEVSVQAGQLPRVRLALDLVAVKLMLEGEVELQPLWRHLPREFFEELRAAIDRYLAEEDEE